MQVGLATAVVDFMNETVMENDICCCFKECARPSSWQKCSGAQIHERLTAQFFHAVSNAMII